MCNDAITWALAQHPGRYTFKHGAGVRGVEAFDLRRAERKLVLVVLADMADADEWACWPMVATVAERADLSRRQVRRILQSLEADLYLLVEARPGRSNRYRLNRHRGEAPWPYTAGHPGRMPAGDNPQ